MEYERGTIEYRFIRLLDELEKRLPDPSPLSAAPPEGRVLQQLDELIARAPKLVYDVMIDDWAHVARVLKLYKRKAHSGFFLEVEEQAPQFRVRVFKR